MIASSRQGRHQPARGRRSLRPAHAHDPLSRKDRAGTHDNRGVMLDMMGRTERRGRFQCRHRAGPRPGRSLCQSGRHADQEGPAEEALAQINKGIDLGMAFPHIGYYDRAVAEQMLGRFKEAYYDYKKVLEIDPHFAMAEERLKDFVVTRVPAKSPG